jgi:PAS domain S-box-containing protein
VELDLVRRDGTTFPAIVNATAILDESGAFVRSRSTVTDITERRRAEKELEAFFDVSLDMLCLASVEGYFLRLNPAWETTLGWSLEELTTRPFVEFVHPDDREATVAEAARLGTGQKTVSFQNRYRCKDDSYRWLLWSSAGIPDRGLLIASARDITEQRETQARLVTAKEEAERANHAKDAFLSRMSHELRTPLNAVIGFAQLLEIGDLSDEQSGNVRQIRRGGEHLLELINEVLDISRIASGALGSSLEPVDVGVVVREVVALLQPLATDRGVSLRAENLDGMRVLADPQRLTQVLLNLVANAIKYNVEDGSVVVQPQETEGGRVRVSITDTGLGIAPESLPRLFEPFDRLGAEGTSVEGTGLGLALSLALVKAMDGSIEVESELGRGSRFSVELPVAQPQAEHAARASRQRATPGPGAERMVLHVEDNLSSLLLVERIFERRPGVRVMGAMQGGLALDLARQHQPVLILLDLHLPDMEGEEVLRHLRGDPATVSIPVAVLSADATESQIAHLLAAGADDYLTKPIDVRRFLAVVDGLIGAG